MIAFHTQFLEEIRAGNIAKVFNQQADYLKMYIAYVTNYNGILNLFAKEKKNKKLEKFLEKKRKEHKGLTSHLILPIQRIPRYMLLLDELKKKTPKSHEFEYRDIDNALKKVELICDEINERQREIENMSQCLLITNKLKGLNINIVESQRKYIEHFIFKRKSDQKNKQFFVFNDIIIIADLKWKTEQIIKLTKFEAKRPSKKNEELLIRIIDGHNRKNSNLNDKTVRNNKKLDEKNEPIPYIVALDVINKQKENQFHENISNIDLFIKVLNKYRTKLYKNELSRVNAMENSRQSDSYHGQDKESLTVDIEMIRDEQEKNELAKWQEDDKSKGNKNKVLSMLKSPSEDTM